MSDHSKKGPQTAVVDTQGGSFRKPYAPPRLRVLGSVNAITLAFPGAPATDEGSRKKPNG